MKDISFENMTRHVLFSAMSGQFFLKKARAGSRARARTLQKVCLDREGVPRD